MKLNTCPNFTFK